MTGRTALLGTTALIGAGAVWTWAASGIFLVGVDLATGSRLLDHYGFPTWQWWQYLPYRGSNATVDLWLKISAAAAAAPLALAAPRWLRHMAGQARPLHGESHFASRREARQGGLVFASRPPGDGIILGRTGWGPFRQYVCLRGEGNVSLYARTRGGKGVSFVVPNCLNWTGSLIALDIKGELYRKTAACRQAMGQEVFCFAPSATDGRSHRYNPYSVVPRGTPRCIDMVHRINAILVPPNPRAENPYWDNSARNAINGAAVILAETPGEPLHVGAVRRGFTRPDWRDYWRRLITSARDAGRPYPQTAVDGVLSLVDDPDDKGREGVRRTIESHLGLWASPTVVAATETSDFDLSQIRKRGQSIYLRLRPTEMRRFRPLTTLLFQQLLDLNTEVEFGQDPDHSHRVLMMLDEFWAAGRMDMLADASAFIAAFGFHMAYVLQSKAQAVSLYGTEGSDNLFENTSAEIVFGVKGVKLAREVSEMAGHDTVQETTKNRPRFWGALQWSKQTESEAARRRALLLPQEVQRLSPKRQIIFRAGLPPMLTGRVIYWKDPLFRHLEAEPPEVPMLKVHIARDNRAG